MSKSIFVTQPFLPPLEEFTPYLQEIWDSKWLTNNGKFHQKLEQALCDYLGVKYVSLFANGTLALITALQALKITGEVITTPYSFVATTHALWWNGIKPVFADIERDTFNINPANIEAAITPNTTAILPVHVYGNPCLHSQIQKIADTYGLKVIYDAAHAFGVKQNGISVADYGDLSVLSFHATKVYNTFEGGAIICHDEITKKRIDDLKNFGFHDEITVAVPGINAKMNEFQAALGLLQLKYIDRVIEKQKIVTQAYREQLAEVSGITYMKDLQGISYNYSYFPILIESRKFGRTRDEVYEILKKNNVFSRRYFYPLISSFPPYRGVDSADPAKLKIAEEISLQILCLPIFYEMEIKDIDYICGIINANSKNSRCMK